jgi:hypothetical protein
MHPTDTSHLRLPFSGQRFCVQHNDEQCKELARLWALLNCDTPGQPAFSTSIFSWLVTFLYHNCSVTLF